ncbi:FAD-dependent monooxygenase [Actinomadura sp. 7K507]|uniref:FAD-dependent monooxygenase n=1 Tax=Actinomadura sp. 7K507 TaxID=2530365 RepID=UPI00104EC255|nr:FAD-dependent monooxygenase [Actinomadura sp. 7K507]TDC85728.1 FAD-dependent oxidoreductase [Actinomadura sp. 7K507]
MEPVIDTDVLVVGAGPTGLTAAVLLADHGVRVLVVEKNQGTGDEPRAISVTDETLRVMQGIGVLGRLAPEMLMDTGARYFGRRGRLLAEVHPASSRLGQPAKSQFDQPVMEESLLGAARDRDRVRLCFEAEAVSARDLGDRVETTVRGPWGETAVHARWVIACDGGRSPIRHRSGIPMEGSTQVEEWIVVDLLNTGEHEKFAEFHCNGVRPAVVVPGAGGRCRFEFMLLSGETAERMTTPDMVATLTEPYLHRRVAPGDIRRARVYVAHQRVARDYRRGRVLLAGDAAHMMPPFAGQGLNAGIRDAANLAWKVAAAVQGTGTDALVGTYETERRPHAVQMVEISRRIGLIVMSTDPKITVARDLLLRGTGLVPPLKRWITGMRFLKQPHFARGCVAPAPGGLPRAVTDLVGRSLPQPTVRLPEGGTAPLDTVLGPEWNALRFGAGPGAGVEIIRLGAEPGAPDAPVVVTDESGAFAGPGAEPVTLLVRPDRYVAAAAPAGREPETFAELAHLVPWLPEAWRRQDHDRPALSS